MKLIKINPFLINIPNTISQVYNNNKGVEILKINCLFKLEK